MALKHLYRLIGFAFCFFLCAPSLSAQFLNTVEISMEKKRTYQTILNRNKLLIKFIENMMTQNGLPKMMRNLSLIESGFDKNIVSSANAGGIWQLMQAHAAQYGLKSEDRFDIYHSTKTAVKSLKNLYKKYGNWITVIAAYNCGEGNVKKAMDKAKSERYDKFYTFLPSETIHHIKKFMEACTVTGEIDLLLADYKLSAFKPLSPSTAADSLQKNMALASTTINTAYNLDIIAEEMNITRSDLDQWNPNLQTELFKTGTAKLFLPVDQMPDFLLLKNTILNRSILTPLDHDT